jgi:hypothetical protein
MKRPGFWGLFFLEFNIILLVLVVNSKLKTFG